MENLQTNSPSLAQKGHRKSSSVQDIHPKDADEEENKWIGEADPEQTKSGHPNSVGIEQEMDEAANSQIHPPFLALSDDNVPGTKRASENLAETMDQLGPVSVSAEKKRLDFDDKKSNDSQVFRIRLGIMCVEKKLGSRPMKEILGHLGKTPEIQIIKFDNNMLFNRSEERR